jgi:UDP-glucose 4-epimerase
LLQGAARKKGFNNMMIVTGAAGFIGSHLVDRLLAEGHQVLGIDNFRRGLEGNLSNSRSSSAFHFVEADLDLESSVTALVDPLLGDMQGKVDTIWHMAANSDIAAGVNDPSVDLRDTFLTTVETLKLMRRNAIPNIVFASTSAVYGETSEVMHEAFGPLLPISSYGAMKLASEAVISAAAESYIKRIYICRFPNVIGNRSTHGIIYDLANKLLARNDELEVLGDGLQRKPYLHVLELVDAMMFIRRHSPERRSIFNVGPKDSGVEVKDIARMVIEAAQLQSQIRYTGGDRGWVGDVPRFEYSIEKLARLGWSPSHSSADAVERAAREVVSERGL